MDGRVHLQAEGAEAEVRAFVAEVQEELSSFIKKSEIKTGAGSRKHTGFIIGTSDG
jgi:acylphosphatase